MTWVSLDPTRRLVRLKLREDSGSGGALLSDRRRERRAVRGHHRPPDAAWGDRRVVPGRSPRRGRRGKRVRRGSSHRRRDGAREGLECHEPRAEDGPDPRIATPTEPGETPCTSPQESWLADDTPWQRTGSRRFLGDTEREQDREGLQSAHQEAERPADECFAALETSNAQLKQKIQELERADQSLQAALSEIKTLQRQLREENRCLREEIKGIHNFGEIVGESAAIKDILSKAAQVAPSDATVLLLGETGVGKELLARAIHQWSRRKDRPLVKVNCAALPANLIESELFGHERGAFTGAHARQVGRFEVAHGGTLFLDEIGELPLELQTKLLRVLQDGEFERLGNPRTFKADVRVIAATNRNLEQDVGTGRFRPDLYYRLQVFQFTVPPLRERREDIPLLVGSLVQRFSRKAGKAIHAVPGEVMQALTNYPWPGNVRELENVMERAVIHTQGPTLHLMDALALPPAAGRGITRTKTLAEAETDCIVRALEDTLWKIEGRQGAAAALGLSPSTLRRRMQRLGIHRQDPRR
ncbi:MAG: sigma 54-interacting transcriptional regulator [Deltaproteobacteria bacterium]|nr:sigma 54-interacting transcriptional regulator [Deltaproteobacteria bacterium]